MMTVKYANAFLDDPELAHVKINVVTPGYVATDLNGFRGERSTDEGARASVYWATVGDDGETGGVFDEKRFGAVVIPAGGPRAPRVVTPDLIEASARRHAWPVEPGRSGPSRVIVPSVYPPVDGDSSAGPRLSQCGTTWSHTGLTWHHKGATLAPMDLTPHAPTPHR